MKQHEDEKMKQHEDDDDQEDDDIGLINQGAYLVTNFQDQKSL